MTGWCVTENLVAATGRGFQDAKTTALAILEWTRNEKYVGRATMFIRKATPSSHAPPEALEHGVWHHL